MLVCRAYNISLEWIFNRCWVQCSHIVRSNRLTVLFKFLYPHGFSAYLFCFKYWERGVVFRPCCCWSRISSESAHRPAQILALFISANHSGELYADFWGSASAQLPPAQNPVQYPIPAALAALNSDLYSFQPVGPMISEWTNSVRCPHCLFSF